MNERNWIDYFWIFLRVWPFPGIFALVMVLTYSESVMEAIVFWVISIIVLSAICAEISVYFDKKEREDESQ